MLQKLGGPTQLSAVLEGAVAQPDNSRPAATTAAAKRADRLIAVRKFIDIVGEKFDRALQVSQCA
jgi:hypothetical protein